MTLSDFVIVKQIELSLLPEYKLVIEGKEKIRYGSVEEKTAWLHTAESFVRSVEMQSLFNFIVIYLLLES